MDNNYLEGIEDIKMTTKAIQHFLERLWNAVSDPRNHSVVKWSKGGRICEVIDSEVFYHELCPKFYAGCNENYFNYFTMKCGFENIPTHLDKVFFHLDFLQHEFARIKNIQPKETLYTPFAYYSYVLETPNNEVPFIDVKDEGSLPLGNVEVTAGGTLKKRESGGSKAASVQDTDTEIETLPSLGSSSMKNTLALILSCHSPSEFLSLASGSSCSTLVGTPSPNSAISWSTPESLLPTEPSKEIPTKNDYEKDLTLNLNECRLEEQALDSSSSTLTSRSNFSTFSVSSKADLKDSSELRDIPLNHNESKLGEQAPDSSSSTLTGGSNSPTLSASPKADLKDSSELLDISLNHNEIKLGEQAPDSSSSTLTLGSNSPTLSASPKADLKNTSESLDISASTENIKDSKSSFKLDLVSRVSKEECADPNSVSVPRISTSNGEL